MRYILLLILGITFSAFSSASTLTLQADSAYIEDRYANAIELYEKSIANEGASSITYYNLGNAYYRSDKLGKAIICYERALILDPTNEDARTNLNFVNTKITDRLSENGTFLSNFFNNIINSRHSNSWAMLAMVSFLLFLTAIAIYVFSSKISLKKSGFFGGIIFILATTIFIIFSSQALSNATSHNKAVIISPSTILSTSPRQPKDRSEEALLLHEGTKVEITDSVTNIDGTKWYDVKVDNNHRAWLKSSDAEII